MSLPPMPYSPHPSSYPPNPGVQAHSFNVQTPPPPPPKPSSHEASRRGTPQTRPPLPSPPHPSSISREDIQSQFGTQGEPMIGNPESFQDNPDASRSQPQAPGI